MIELKFGCDCLQSLFGQFFGFDGFEKVGNISTFHFFHGDKEPLLLYLPVDGESSNEFVDLFGKISAASGELIPVDIRVGANQIEDLLIICLNVLDFNCSRLHVEYLYIDDLIALR